MNRNYEAHTLFLGLAGSPTHMLKMMRIKEDDCHCNVRALIKRANHFHALKHVSENETMRLLTVA